jgi:hypothetical protein
MISDEEKRDALIALTKSQGWEILLGLAREQMERRTTQVLYQPLSDSWTSPMQEYMKGEIQGIKTLMEIPRVFIEGYEPEPEEIEDAE